MKQATRTMHKPFWWTLFFCGTLLSSSLLTGCPSRAQTLDASVDSTAVGDGSRDGSSGGEDSEPRLPAPISRERVLLVALPSTAALQNVAERIRNAMRLAADETSFRISIRSYEAESPALESLFASWIEELRPRAFAAGLEVRSLAAMENLARQSTTRFYAFSAQRNEGTSIGYLVPSALQTASALVQELRMQPTGERAAVEPMRLCIAHPQGSNAGPTVGTASVEPYVQAAALEHTALALLPYADNATNFRDLAQSIRRSNCTHVHFLDNARRIAVIVPSLATLGIFEAGVSLPRNAQSKNVRMSFGITALRAPETHGLGRYFQGALFVTPFWSGSSPAAQVFSQQYRIRFQSDPDVWAAYAYDLVRWIANPENIEDLRGRTLASASASNGLNAQGSPQVPMSFLRWNGVGFENSRH